MNFFSRVINRIKREYTLQYNRLRVKQLVKKIALNSDAERNSPVIIFNASTRLSGLSQNAGFSLITSLALRKRNIPVHQFVCQRGLRPCVLGTDRDHPFKSPPCRECIRTSRLLFAGANQHHFQFISESKVKNEIQNLTLDGLIAYEYEDIPLGQMILPSMRWILRRHHLVDNEKNRFLAQSYILSAWNVYQQFNVMLDSLKPQAVIVFNGMFYPEAMVRLAAQQKGVTVYSHEVGMLSYSAFFTDKEATAYPVKVDNSFQLGKDQEDRLDAYLSRRFSGDFQTAGVQFWPEMHALNKEISEKMKAYSAMVPIFTNVIFDTSQSHANVIFKHMFAWLDVVLEKIKQHPDVLFVIRAHPDEIRPGKESRESVSEWFFENQLNQIQNILFVPPDEFVSSYELIKKAKFVMVYNSTVGLEASIMNKPVLCAGKARYTQIPTVFFPKSKNAYTEYLDSFLSDDEVDQPEQFIKNARTVLYSQLFRASLPFNEFLEEDGVWRGYVRLKKFSVEVLDENKPDTLDVVTDGIVNKQPFIREI